MNRRPCARKETSSSNLAVGSRSCTSTFSVALKAPLVSVRDFSSPGEVHPEVFDFPFVAVEFHDRLPFETL